MATFPVFAAPGYRFDEAPDLSRAETRLRLSPAAIEGFFSILAKWRVPIETGRELLGSDRSRANLYDLKRRHRSLSQDELTRVSYLVGIYKALHILLPEPLADEWMVRPNDNALFGGRTPLEFIRQQGIPGFREVRNLLDAARGSQ